MNYTAIILQDNGNGTFLTEFVFADGLEDTKSVTIPTMNEENVPLPVETTLDTAAKTSKDLLNNASEPFYPDLVGQEITGQIV